MTPKLFKSPAAWRAWLERNHDTAKEIWLVYYKKGAGKKSVTYEEALDEALSFGWIDSTVRRLDAERYMQRYTPRNPKSVWSKTNKARIKKLVADGRMTEAGQAKVRAAKRSGNWKTLDKVDNLEAPPDLLAALAARPAARENFDRLSASQKKLWIWWIVDAKRPETRTRRIAAAGEWIEAGRKIGIETPRLSDENQPTGRERSGRPNPLRGPA
jgi:uncharacterized protein YdeI (YjbR/CyaY-like superfamily)